MMRSDFDKVSACASVLATTKSHPTRPAVIMLLTALPPAPPTPKTVMRGLSSRMSGILRLMVMAASSKARARTPLRPVRRRPIGEPHDRGSSKALPEPSSDPCEVAVRPCHQVPRATRFVVFEVSDLRIDQEPGGRRESRSLCDVGQPRNAERAADPHLAPENAGGDVWQSPELARTAGKHDGAMRVRREGRGSEPVAHHLEYFFHARRDDPR